MKTGYTRCKCAECAENIDFSIDHVGQDVACPHCGKITKLYVVVKPPPVAKLVTPPPPPKEIDPALEYLELVRKNSCYGILRSVINLTFWLCSFVVVIIALRYFINSTWNMSTSYAPFIFIGSMGGAAVGVFILFACRQSAFLLIDIADTLLREHLRNRMPLPDMARRATGQ